MPDSFQIRHEPDQHRFVTTVEGVDATLQYRLEEGCMVITHTLVPDAVGGRGIAAGLTRAAFDHARDAGLQVRPACSYAAGWAERHPEYSGQLG